MKRAIALLVVIAGTAHAAEPAAGLHLTLPAGWTQQVTPAAAGKPPSVEIRSNAADGPLHMKVQMIPVPQGKLSDDVVHGIVDKMVANALKVSVEKEITPTPLTGNFSGYAFTCTSKNQKGPADQQYQTTAAFVHAGNLAMAVSLSHRKDSKDLQPALDMLTSATFGGPATKPTP